MSARRTKLSGVTAVLKTASTASWHNCVEVARSLFNDHFYLRVRQLLTNFPPDYADPGTGAYPRACEPAIGFFPPLRRIGDGRPNQDAAITVQRGASDESLCAFQVTQLCLCQGQHRVKPPFERHLQVPSGRIGAIELLVFWRESDNPGPIFKCNHCAHLRVRTARIAC